MKVLSVKLSRFAFTVAACFAAAHSFAAGIKFDDIVEGAVVTEDRVDMGFLSPIPIPPGQWRVLKKANYILPWGNVVGDIEMTRVTFMNTDKDAPMQLFSFSTNRKRYLRVGSSPLYKCQDLTSSIYTQKNFDLPSSGFVYACAQIRSNPGIRAKFESFSKVHLNADSRGYLDGVILPLLGSSVDMDALGKAPVSIELEVSKNAERLTYYSFYLKADQPYEVINAQLPEIAQVNDWLIQNGKEIIKSIHGDEFKLTKLSLSQALSGSKGASAPVIDPATLDTLVLPTTDDKNRAAYKKFIESTAADNRAFYFTETGQFWGWNKHSWPFNERQAYDACQSAARGKGSPCKLHTVDNQIVWAEANGVR